MKRLTRSTVKDIIYTVYEGYRHDSGVRVRGEDFDLPEWGSYLDKKDEEKNRQVVKDQMVKIFNVTPEVVESVLGSMEHLWECGECDSPRVVNDDVKDWTNVIYLAQNKKTDTEKLGRLRKTVETMFDEMPKGLYGKHPDYKDTDDPNWKIVLRMMNEEESWEKEQTKVLVGMGVPKSECHVILHYGRISRLNEKYKKDRVEVYERLLQENHIFLK
jgi:hypothetical protein